jgi:hypothetical protein
MRRPYWFMRMFLRAALVVLPLPALVVGLSPTLASAQQDEVARTLANVRTLTGARVIVEAVTTGITLVRVTVRRGREELSLTVEPAELDPWIAETENLLTMKIRVRPDEVSKNFGPKLGMIDHKFIQVSRETDREATIVLFTISDADEHRAMATGMTAAQGLTLMRALRRGSQLSKGVANH